MRFRRTRSRLETIEKAPVTGDTIESKKPAESSAARPRILILSASCGAGHVRAAEAVQLALERTAPDAVLANVDVMNFTNAAFRRIYNTAYFDLVDKAPHLIGFLYDKTDRPTAWPSLDRMRLRLTRLNLMRLVTLIVGGHWDLAVSTHFLPAEIIASLRRKGRIDFPQATVTTDFDTHHMWFNEPCERFFAASEEARINLAACGVPLETIETTGIPIHPAFVEHKVMNDCRRFHDLSVDRPVVLQLAGGFSISRVRDVHRGILDCRLPLHVVAICGRNARAKAQFEAVACPSRHRRSIIGFTREIDEFMAAADVIVSKPGGLTSSEALARGTPMLIIDPIPGQESRNSDYLLEHGAAIKCNNLASLTYKLTHLLTTPGRLASAREAASALGRPQAGFEVARSLLSMLPASLPELTLPPAGAPRRTRLRRLLHRV